MWGEICKPTVRNDSKFALNILVVIKRKQNCIRPTEPNIHTTAMIPNVTTNKHALNECSINLMDRV